MHRLSTGRKRTNFSIFSFWCLQVCSALIFSYKITNLLKVHQQCSRMESKNRQSNPSAKRKKPSSSSTNNKDNTITSTPIKFIGPTQTEFGTFLSLARYSLDNYWPGWRDYETPKNHIIPAIFHFKNPHLSDVEIRDEKLNLNGDYCRTKIDRQSDQAEYVIFNALTELSTKSVNLAPFLVVQNLNLDKIKTDLGQIFPDLESSMINSYVSNIHEYDFVLIGPKIGIFVIEVKSSMFTNAKDFSPKNHHLPEHISKGIKQLREFDKFLEFLEKITNSKIPPETLITRLLFMPNLEKQRFDDWMADVYSKNQKQDSDLFNGRITFWFKEDTIFSGKKIDIEKIESLLKNSAIFTQENSMDQYEDFSAIIAALGSIAILKCQSIEVELEKLKLSEQAAVAEASDRIYSQDHLGKLECLTQKMTIKSKQPKRPQIELVRPMSEQFSKLIILTPDQQRILCGPNRQVIIGAAGTGKTILLQEKAIRLLNQDESVRILASNNYVCKYKEVLKGFPADKFQVESWIEWAYKMFDELSKNGMVSWFDDKESFETLCRTMEKIRSDKTTNLWLDNTFRLILDYDHVLIDDAFDKCPNERIGMIVALLAFARVVGPSDRVLWIAVDYHFSKNTSDEQNMLYCSSRLEKTQLETLFKVVAKPGEIQPIDDWPKSIDEANMLLKSFGDYENVGFAYSAVIINKAMRYPENFFHTMYFEADMENDCFLPIPGHKGQGLYKAFVNHCATVDEAMESIWKNLLIEIEPVIKIGSNLKSVALVTHSMTAHDAVGAHWNDDDTLAEFLIKRIQDIGGVIPITRGAYDTASNDLIILDWTEASSLEWPTVIRVACLPFYSVLEWTEYASYRTCTRATGKLVNVLSTFKHEFQDCECSDYYSYHDKEKPEINVHDYYRETVG